MLGARIERDEQRAVQAARAAHLLRARLLHKYVEVV
jgi:hypothetical protein